MQRSPEPVYLLSMTPVSHPAPATSIHGWMHIIFAPCHASALPHLWPTTTTPASPVSSALASAQACPFFLSNRRWPQLSLSSRLQDTVGQNIWIGDRELKELAGCHPCPTFPSITRIDRVFSGMSYRTGAVSNLPLLSKCLARDWRGIDAGKNVCRMNTCLPKVRC